MPKSLHSLNQYPRCDLGNAYPGSFDFLSKKSVRLSFCTGPYFYSQIEIQRRPPTVATKPALRPGIKIKPKALSSVACSSQGEADKASNSSLALKRAGEEIEAKEVIKKQLKGPSGNNELGVEDLPSGGLRGLLEGYGSDSDEESV